MIEKLETFICPNHAGNLRLDAHSCATMWDQARVSRHDSFNRLRVCCGCHIGAKNAGHEVDPDERKHGLIDSICTRCHRTATRFVYGCTCVSCYNRGREVLLNKNARGAPPKKLRKLIDVDVAYIDEGVTKRVTVSRVVDQVEARLTLVRKGSRVMEFVHTAKTVVHQPDFFGAMLSMVSVSKKRPKLMKNVSENNESQLNFGDFVSG